VNAPADEPVGVILAGGLGRRIGGAKALLELGGRPLLLYPLGAMQAALQDVAVIAKPDTELPEIPGARVWREPERPRHPLLGIRRALELAAGRAVMVCAADMPFVPPELLRRIALTDPGRAPAVVASRRGETQPLLGCYHRAAATWLPLAAIAAGHPARELVAALGPRIVEVDDPRALFNVNTPGELREAEALLASRR
jgi:molybdopterin-guanine dinucleotide biosynthesis protein A